MHSVNPNINYFLWDPWIFNIPVALKPTFINMDMDFEHISISNFILDDHWDFQNMNSLFGDNSTSLNFTLPTIELNSDSH